VALGQGALEQAMATFDAAQAAATTIGDPLIPAWCLVYQALICCEQGNPERAAALLRNHPDMDQVGYRQHQPLLRAVVSVVACRFGDYRRCARLLGSAVHDVPMRSPEKEITDRSATIARRALGEDEYRREWDAGHRMQPGEVRVEILQLLSEHAPPTVDGGSTMPHGLSMRELEVLRLIADGMTDRRIAETLSISPRTAEWHVRNVLGKLGAANRAEAAVLATRDYLV
jgi:non-specific serine/threonine protein kinase